MRARRETDIRIAARIGAITQKYPGPGPDKVRLTVELVWEVWTNQNLATDRLALNLIHVYDRHWWEVWKRRRIPQTGLPEKGAETTEYRRRIHASQDQPIRTNTTFEYAGDREGSEKFHWEFQLVLVLGVPHITLRCPIFLHNGDSQQELEDNSSGASVAVVPANTPFRRRVVPTLTLQGKSHIALPFKTPSLVLFRIQPYRVESEHPVNVCVVDQNGLTDFRAGRACHRYVSAEGIHQFREWFRVKPGEYFLLIINQNSGDTAVHYEVQRQ